MGEGTNQGVGQGAALSATRPGVVDRLDATLAKELRAQLAEIGVEGAIIVGRRRGGTSTCYFLRLEPSNARAVLKVGDAGESLLDEYAALAAVACSPAELSVRLPRPLSLFERRESYLMEYVAGRPLPQAAGWQPQDLAPAIVEGLRSYHRVVGAVYGDFHSQNVLIDEAGGLIFIDPAPSRDIRGANIGLESHAFIESDLGLWIYNAALALVGANLWRPVSSWRMCRLAVELVAAASPGCAESEPFARRVLDLGGRHVRRLQASQWPRHRAMALPVAVAFRLLTRGVMKRAAARG